MLFLLGFHACGGEEIPHGAHQPALGFGAWMWSVEHRPHAAQRDSHTTSRSFTDLGSDGPQQRLDLVPPKVSRGRLRKDLSEGTAVAPIHAVMISKIDIDKN